MKPVVGQDFILRPIFNRPGATLLGADDGCEL